MWAYVDGRILKWRTGEPEGQIAVLIVLLLISVGLLVGSLVEYMLFPAAVFIIPMLVGSLTLRYQPLLALILCEAMMIALTVTKESVQGGMTLGRISTLITMILIVCIFLFEASRRRTGLPGVVGEAMLIDLNKRLQRQGIIPQLPGGWRSQSAMRSAGGARFAGDFLVANLSSDESEFEMILVDVCGKGVAAGTSSLQFAGALGGLIGALPPLGLFAAANDYLLRQQWEDGFATAVHVSIHLPSGRFSIINAGHPPAMQWSTDTGEWLTDDARGVALGIMERPDFQVSHGQLEPGEALLFYTDGVIETRDHSLAEGLDWLRSVARDAVSHGFDDIANRILDRVASRSDDRAVLVVDRPKA